MSRLALSGFAFGVPAPRVRVEETPAQAGVPREDLWAVVKAAQAFRRVVDGRFDAEKFARVKGELEKAFDNLPRGVL